MLVGPIVVEEDERVDSSAQVVPLVSVEVGVNSQSTAARGEMQTGAAIVRIGDEVDRGCQSLEEGNPHR